MNANSLLSARIPGQVHLVDVEHIGGQCGADKAIGFLRVVLEPDLERDDTISTQVQCLAQLLCVPVPHVELAAVLCAHQRRVKSLRPGVWDTHGSDVLTRAFNAAK